MKNIFYSIFVLVVTLHHVFFYIGCKKNNLISFEFMKNYLILSKMIILVLFYYWIKYFILDPMTLSWIPETNFGLLGILLLLFGQYLNYLSYKSLGINGIYYGKEYGKINKVNFNKFPYSHFSDPQYIGCIMTLMGLFFMFIIRKNYKIDEYGTILIAYMILLYIYSIKFERSCINKNI